MNENYVFGPADSNLSYEGNFKDQKTEFYLMEYDENSYSYNKVKLKDIPSEGSPKIRWVRVRGMADLPKIKKLAKKFNVHNLNLKNILNVNNRSELLSTGERFNVVFNVPNGKTDFKFERTAIIRIRQINTIITIEENPKGIFSDFNKEIEADKENMGANPVDHLLFILLEHILDQYFTTISNLQDQLRQYGVELNEKDVNPKIFAKLHTFKGKVMRLVDSVEPVKNAIEKGLRFRIEENEEYKIIHARIVGQHLENILKKLDYLDGRVSHQFDLAISLNDYKMNQVMKSLTMVATIFLPLTFIAGIYGMNFKFMPELDLKYGYFGTLGLMLLVVVGSVFFFKKKKWI